MVGATLVAMLGATPPTAGAQVFFSSRPEPELAVRPLFIVADVSPDAAGVDVAVMFSLLIPPDQSALAFEQDLYLLWPGEVVPATSGPAGIGLPPAVAAQVSVIREGRLALQAQRHYEAGADRESVAGGAPFITVVQHGGALGQSPAATYIRIPWSQRLANQAWLMSVRFTATDLVKPKTSTWLGRTIAGRRSVLALGFNDVGSPASFAMYYWQRDNLLPVASPARLVANFAEADRLAVDAVFPPAARREPSPSRAATEAISLFLAPGEDIAPQVLRVEFGYFSRLQSWGPILIPALFFALGNMAAVVVRHLAEDAYRRLGWRLQLGRRRASSSGVETGTVIPRAQLSAIVPGETREEEVRRLCGPEVEEREDLARPRRRVLVYRGQRHVPHRRWTWGWLATVSHWDVERHEVEIVVEDGVVQHVQSRIGRARGAGAPPIR